MNFKYKDLAKKLHLEAMNKFYLEQKNIFQKSPKDNSDVFLTQLILVTILYLMQIGMYWRQFSKIGHDGRCAKD